MSRTPPPPDEPRLDRTAVATFDSFEAADAADRLEEWAMSPQERFGILEFLRRQQYPDGRTPPDFQRVLDSVEFPPR